MTKELPGRSAPEALCLFASLVAANPCLPLFFAMSSRPEKNPANPSAIWRMPIEMSPAGLSNKHHWKAKFMDDVAIVGAPLQSVASPGITTVLTIIVPTLNERENIEPLVALVAEALPDTRVIVHKYHFPCAGRHIRTCSCPRSAQPAAALSSTDRPARSRNSLHRRFARFLLAPHRDNGCRSAAR